MTRKPTRAKGLGVTDELYAALLAAQGGHCALCAATSPKRLKKDGTAYRFHVDHDHTTGRVRGLLCFRCNTALPHRATAAWLYLAAAYVDTHGTAITEDT